MIGIKKRLNEAEEVYVYEDVDTGNQYIYNGSNLVMIKRGSRGIGYKGNTERDWDPSDFGETEQQMRDRITGIDNTLSSQDFSDAIRYENQSHLERDADAERRAQDERQQRQWANDGALQLEVDLREFLITQIEEYQRGNPLRPNRNYVDSDIIKQALKWDERPAKPSITFYFDRSGSWDEDKLAEGRRIVNGIEQEFVWPGLIDLTVKYFANTVGDYYDAPMGRGTEGDPVAVDIINTEPDNVFIMTDADVSSMSKKVVVPGMVYYLFKGGQSSAFPTHITGELGTKIFDI